MALSFSCCTSFSPQNQVKESLKIRSSKSLDNVKNLLNATGVPSLTSQPLESLKKGNWVKLICGASFEDLIDIRNLSLVYTLAGVDCIDCAADASVVSAVNEGIEAAMDVVPLRKPWVMISVNDDEDLHFRKAAFDPSECPMDCSRPCEAVCPANAIKLEEGDSLQGGVINDRCYGCGRCLPICPYDKIKAVTYLRDAVATSQLMRRKDVDAIEIHTNGRQTASFEEHWDGLRDSISHLRLVAISFPDVGKSVTTLMSTLFSIMKPNLSCYNLWQLDGRPMSGDIGRGATREALAFAVRLAAAEDLPPGFLQLAGGTNAHTVNGLKKHGLFQSKGTLKEGIFSAEKFGSSDSLIGGVAYGGYARKDGTPEARVTAWPVDRTLAKIVGRVLRTMESQHGFARIEDHPEYLSEALKEALSLVAPVKCYDNL